MSDDKFWESIELQIEHARSQIVIHQQQRIFFFELIIAVIGFGLLINLLTSIVYDVLIKQEPIQNAFLYCIGIIFAVSILFYYLIKIRSKYSPIKPRIRFELDPEECIENFNQLWSTTKKILEESEDEQMQEPSDIVLELWESIKENMYDRPPFKSWLILLQEHTGIDFLDLSFTTEYIGVKYQLDFWFSRSDLIMGEKPMGMVTITILEPHKPHVDDIWDRSTIVVMIMDLAYILRTGIENFNNSHLKEN